MDLGYAFINEQHRHDCGWPIRAVVLLVGGTELAAALDTDRAVRR